MNRNYSRSRQRKVEVMWLFFTLSITAALGVAFYLLSWPLKCVLGVLLLAAVERYFKLEERCMEGY